MSKGRKRGGQRPNASRHKKRTSTESSSPFEGWPEIEITRAEAEFGLRVLESDPFRRAFHTFAKRRVARAIPVQEEAVLTGESATLAMAAGTNAAIAMAADVARELSPYEWLKYLRWMPAIFYSGGEKMIADDTYAEGQLITEIMSASTGDRPAALSTASPNRLSDPQLGAVMKMVALGALVRHYKVMWRCAAKGVPITVEHDRLPQPDLNSDAWKAIQIFESRRGSQEDISNMTAGTIARGLSVDVSHHRLPTVLLLMSHGLHDTNSRMNFILAWERYRVPTLLRGQAWFQPDLPTLIFLNNAFGNQLILATGEQKRALNGLGYTYWTRKDLVDLLTFESTHPDWDSLANTFHGFDRHASLAPNRLLELMADRGSVMPLIGGPLLRRVDADTYCVDHVAMGQKLQHLSSPLPGRALPRAAIDIRSKDLEEQVQRLIDATKWKPAPELRSLVGSKVRSKSGNIITDLDAIAASGTTCILVDCKSFVPGDMNEAEYGVIANVAARLEKAIDEWERKVALAIQEASRVSPLRKFAKVVPLVVTAGACFVPLSVAERYTMGGLRAVSSIEEMLTYLQNHQG